LDNASERRFGNGKEPRVLWKNHAAFIAILLHSGGGSEGKDRDSRRGAAMPCKGTPFVMQRISVTVQIAAASEIRQALGMSLALSAA
jgi:hypothetical protein